MLVRVMDATETSEVDVQRSEGHETWVGSSRPCEKCLARRRGQNREARIAKVRNRQEKVPHPRWIHLVALLENCTWNLRIVTMS